jgi:hypothetical protein
VAQACDRNDVELMRRGVALNENGVQDPSIDQSGEREVHVAVTRGVTSGFAKVT